MTPVLLPITLASILVLTALAWLVRKALWPALCPLCAGVAGTWLWLLVAARAGAEIDPLLPAILLGGSVVGLAGAAEKVPSVAGEGARLVWKTLFVTIGFATAWFLATAWWSATALGAGGLIVLWLLPRLVAAGTRRQAGPVADAGQAERVEALEAQMKNCC